MQQGIRVGIVGLGRVAWELENDPLRTKPCTHVGAWSSFNNTNIVAGCDINPEQRDKFSRKYPDSAIYSDYKEMFLQENLDFVSICAYAIDRFAMVKSAIDCGIKGIWCEKAIATSLAEAHKMQDMVQQSGCNLIVSYMRRWEHRYLRVAELVANGLIGKLQSINSHFSGNMLHTGTHAIDVLRMFAGKVSLVQAWLSEQDNTRAQKYHRDLAEFAEDSGGYAILHFDNGIIGIIHGENREYFRFEFELLGSKGMIRIGNTQSELWQIAESTYSKGLMELELQAFPQYKCSNIWVSACTELISSIMKNTPITSGIDNACDNLAIALAAHESHSNNHAVVSMRKSNIGAVVKNR